MKVKNIQEMNEAVFILRHFIDLSARLLPLLYKLDQKITPSIQDLRDKEKILTVFRTYNFETKTSEVLLESHILDLIRDCYSNITKEDLFINKQVSLTNFLTEYNRLKNSWRIIENN